MSRTRSLLVMFECCLLRPVSAWCNLVEAEARSIICNYCAIVLHPSYISSSASFRWVKSSISFISLFQCFLLILFTRIGSIIAEKRFIQNLISPLIFFCYWTKNAAPSFNIYYYYLKFPRNISRKCFSPACWRPYTNNWYTLRWIFWSFQHCSAWSKTDWKLLPSQNMLQ